MHSKNNREVPFCFDISSIFFCYIRTSNVVFNDNLNASGLRLTYAQSRPILFSSPSFPSSPYSILNVSTTNSFRRKQNRLLSGKGTFFLVVKKVPYLPTNIIPLRPPVYQLGDNIGRPTLAVVKGCNGGGPPLLF